MRDAEFPPAEEIAYGSFKESSWYLIVSAGKTFPDFKTLAEVALILVSSVAEHRFSLQNI